MSACYSGRATMLPERWRQIEELFHAALEREPGERQSFLENACRGDEALRGAVERLLQQDAGQGALLSEPIEKLADAVLGARSGARFSSGSMVGSFRILGRLGAGGMGEVYRAEDTRLKRLVAIKVLRNDRDE